MKKRPPYRSRWRSAGIKIVACISHLQGKEIYVLARFTPFVEIGASTFIKACHIGVRTRSLYFRKTILGVIGQYGHRLMNSFFKAFKLRLPGVYFGIPMPKRAIPGAWRTGEAKKFLYWLDLFGQPKDKRHTERRESYTGRGNQRQHSPH